MTTDFMIALIALIQLTLPLAAMVSTEA